MKRYFTMVNTMTFEVDDDFADDGTFKNAFENGSIKIVSHNVNLINPDGGTYNNSDDIDIIKNAIVYGIKEKG